jgi:Uma2 family endonuclease
MAADAALAMDPEFPNLDPAVVAGYRAALPHVCAEILDGELILLPRPKPRHANAATGLVSELDPPFRRGRGGPGGWVMLFEPELHLGPLPDVVSPDIAGWRRSRMPELPEEATISLAPDWVCEVLSDRTDKIDRGKKMRIYRREGVGHYWLVDPRSRVLEVYRLGAEGYLLVDTWEDDAWPRAEPFDAIALDLGRLWER